MKIDCISDLHGAFPKLEGGDLLIIAGDLTARDTGNELMEFVLWAKQWRYKKIIVVAGNHDVSLKFNDECCVFNTNHDSHIQYLCDSGTEFLGYKIWGSPWTQNFRGQNENCKAFGLDIDTQLMEKWEQIPSDTHILITHSPPYGILDKTWKNRFGCKHLRNAVLDAQRFPQLRLHVFGHIHESGGKIFETTLTKFVNASIMNERYEPVNKPVRIEL